MNVKFSIITISYNAGKFISKTLESVRNQSFKNFEHIIVDGGSTDSTLEILSSYSYSQLSVKSEPDRGISNAFNKGVLRATGEYLLFLNCGDYFLNDRVLEKVENEMRWSCEDIFSYSVKTYNKECFPEDEEEAHKIWDIAFIPHQAAFIKRTLFEQVGLYNEDLKIRMDFEFFYRCLKARVTFKSIPEAIVYYDHTGVSARNHYEYEKEGLAVQLIYLDDVTNELLRNLSDFMSIARNSDDNSFVKSLNEKVIRKHTGKCKVVVYGAGARGLDLFMEIKRSGLISELYICDKSRLGQYDPIIQSDIIDPQYASVQFADGVFIISVQNRKIMIEVYTWLQSVGVKTENIYAYDWNSNSIC